MKNVRGFKKILLITFFTAVPVFALAGGAGPGGGAQIESAFRLRGMELVSKVGGSPEANAKCSATVMKNGLEGSKIRVVPTLTGGPQGQHLDAWTVPGDIQLLENSWTKFFNPEYPKMGRSVDALILHEIYRSTGTCDDDNFKISDTVFQLIKVSKKFSKTYTFKYRAKIGMMVVETNQSGFADPNGGITAVCDRQPSDATPYVTCAFFGLSDDVYIASLRVVNGQPMEFIHQKDIPTLTSTYYHDYFSDDESILATYRFIDQFKDIHLWGNLVNQTSVQQPFYIVVDLQTGSGAYGLDRAELNRLY